jgi:hypothetical protein
MAWLAGSPSPSAPLTTFKRTLHSHAVSAGLQTRPKFRPSASPEPLPKAVAATTKNRHSRHHRKSLSHPVLSWSMRHRSERSAESTGPEATSRPRCSCGSAGTVLDVFQPHLGFPQFLSHTTSIAHARARVPASASPRSNQPLHPRAGHAGNLAPRPRCVLLDQDQRKNRQPTPRRGKVDKAKSTSNTQAKQRRQSNVDKQHPDEANST